MTAYYVHAFYMRFGLKPTNIAFLCIHVSVAEALKISALLYIPQNFLPFRVSQLVEYCIAPAMYLTDILLVATATIQITGAAPGCDRKSFMTCLVPMVNYFMGPEGQDLPTESMDYTDKQFGDFCRIGISFFDCYKDYFARCATGAQDAQQFMAKTAQLMKRCDNPTFGSDARTLLQCSNTLNKTKAKALACSNAANRYTMKDMSVLMPSPNGGRLNVEGLNGGAIFDSICCNVKYYRQCSGSEVNDKCGPQEQQVFNSLQDAIESAYDCKTRTTKCPVRPDPSPEDYTSKVDFTSYLAGTTAGNGISTSQRVKSASNSVHTSYTFVGLVLLVRALFNAQWIW